MNKIITHSAEETIACAKKFGAALKPGTVIALEGNLGSGKTTFIKGLALGLGLKDPDEVKSPTFALMHIYPSNIPLYHFDLYRLENEKDAENIGLSEFLNDPKAISCVEWAERAAKLMPANTRRIRFRVEGETTRSIEILDSLERF